MTNNKVLLRPHNFIPYTLIPNFFIDSYLAKINGEFIKVYLVLLRFMSVGRLDFDLSQIADLLLMTESDVLRALYYFQSEKLLTLAFEGNRLKEIHLTNMSPTIPDFRPMASETSYTYNTTPTNYVDKSYSNQNNFPEVNGFNETTTFKETNSQEEAGEPNLKVISNRPEYTSKEVAVFAEQEEFSQLLYIIQKYLGKTLSSNEVKTIISFHDWLGLPIDVIELLIEYCVDNDHRNMRYIEKVAIDWADNDINTLERAKVRTETYNKSYFTILKAYGITDRSPTPKQVKLMDKWLNEYHLDLRLIEEACQRTIAQINKAEMRYTDTILETWSTQGVKTLADVENLDSQKPKTTYTPAQPKSTTKPNKFVNYNQRQYDYDALEKKALELRLKESDGKRYSS